MENNNRRGLVLIISSPSGAGKTTICKKIIESHKGSLKINSKEGEGSTFSIFMPIPK